ncbi:MalY/PatB family protein [Sciscionella sediminilitoris]|uniref:MalY/PatB family protein n=1 Tax=Sciscionella sediminilitoris TaxID=1445613 RepID=UPI0006922953|nr:aminotransferase class I/II-fold pyridoxal phosphate-dependent enzyme [Sciscionella sp. SE31]
MTEARYAGLDWDVARSRERRTKRWSVYGPEVLDLTVAEMDLPIAEPIMAALRDALQRQTVGYPIPASASDLPEIAAGWLTERHGLAAEPAAIGLLPELMRGITHSIRLFTEPESPVVVPTPSYRSFFGAIELAGRHAVEVPMRTDSGEYQLDIEQIDSALAAGAGSVLLCHPANPVGRIFTPAELRALATVIDRHGARVISDEIHAPVRYQREFTPYASLDATTRGHSVTLFSATKAWNIPGLRCGFIALTNPEDRVLWKTLPGAATGGISPLGMLGSAAAFQHGAPWLDNAIRFLEDNRKLLARLFAEADLSAVYRPAAATYLAWLDLRTLGSGARPARLLLDEAAVATAPGPDHGEAGSGFVRLNFATQPEILEEAVRRIIKILGEHG